MREQRVNPLARRQGEEIALASNGQGTLPKAGLATELKYDYAQILEADRKTVMGAAVEIKAHEKRARESMIRIGQKLAQVKALLPHGQFEAWCAVEFAMSQRMARNMMSAAEVFGTKTEIISVLSDTAMYLLAGERVPAAARDEVIIKALATGERPKVKEIQAIIDKHKAPVLPQPTLPLPATIAVVWRVLQLAVPSGEAEPRLAWLLAHREASEYRQTLPAGAALDALHFVRAWRTVHDEVKRAVAQEARKVEASQPQETTQSALLSSSEKLANHLPSPGTLESSLDRRSRLIALLSMLEGALGTVGEEYGQLTGHFAHVPVLRQALEPMITTLKERLG